MEATDLAHLFMQAPVAICIVSGAQYKVELVNERMLQFLSRNSDIVGHPLQQTLTEAREQGLLLILDKVRTQKQPYYVNNFPAIILVNGVREARYFNLVFKPYFIVPGEPEPTGIFCVAHNVTEAVLAHQKLEEEKQHTALALETGGLGMLSTDWNTNTVVADKRTAEIFGFDETQPLQTYLDRIHPEDREIRQRSLEEGIANGTFDFEMRLLLPDGTIRWVRSRGMIQRTAEGKVSGSFGIVQDVTTQKQFAQALHKEVEQRTAELETANKAFQQANADLLRSNSALEEFARAASHDLKEPVRKVQVFASRLRETLGNRLTSSEKDVFTRMENAAERMGLLVDDLLAYSHLNHAPLQPEAIDLNEKLARILSDLELLISEKSAVIEISKLPTVIGHRRQLQQLFQNLISNALKYGRPGVPPHITVTASVETAGNLTALRLQTHMPQLLTNNNQKFHRISVTDNGIGFNSADAEKIFQVFTRLHGKDQYAGTGIGLSIAKKVVEHHGGFIKAKSVKGEGSIFEVYLPVNESLPTPTA